MSKHKKEGRVTVVLEQYWNELRQGREFPSENEINPEDIKHIWDYCFLIHVGPSEGHHYKYTYLGKKLIEAYGDDISKDEVNILVVPTKQRMIEKIEETVKKREPIHDESEFVNADSVMVRYRKIFLPLGRGSEVEYVIGAMRWKGF